MSRQYFQDLLVDPPSANLTAVVATVETALWSVPIWTPVGAGDPRAGKIYRIFASGIMSTGASGTLTITPRWGTTTGGVSLGPSVAQTVPINLASVPWDLEFTLQFRAIGTAASTSTCVGGGHFNGPGTAATAGNSLGLTFGGTAITTADTTTAQGIFIGWTLSVAGSVTPQTVFIQSLN
jgi:hypothetical protein